MRVKYALLMTLTFVASVLAPAAHANHQFGDALLDSGGASEGTTVRTVPAAPLERGGFDWIDAGVGAVVTAGVAMLLLGLVVLARRAREGAETAPAA